MRLLLITNDFPPAVGGIENYAFSLAGRWKPSDVVVVTRWMPGCESFDRKADYEILREPVGTLLPTSGLLAKVKSIVSSRGIDAVHFPSALPLGLLARRIGRPYAISVHGGEFLLASRLPAARQALKWVSAGAAVLLPESSFAEKHIRRILGDKVPLQRVTCGVDPERFRPPQAGRQTGQDPVIVSVSRLIARKGQDTLIRGLPRLLQAHPSARLLIVGGGPRLPHLQKLAWNLRVSHSVTFAGPQPWEKTPEFLSCAHVFALPSRDRFAGTETEGLPLVLLEAAASALPLVAGNVGGIPDAVRPGQTGVLVDGASALETGTALKSLLDDRAGALRMGATARRMVLEEFTWDLVAEKYRAALLRWCF